VDDAIVVLENIVRHMEHGMSRFEAALLGSREIGFTIISMTLSLAAVFHPGVVHGRRGRPAPSRVAAVIAIAVIVSGVVSLTLTPMLCSRFLKPPTQSHGRLYRASERVFEAMLRAIDGRWRLSCGNPQVTVAIFVATLVGTAGLFMVISKGFIPERNGANLRASPRRPRTSPSTA